MKLADVDVALDVLLTQLGETIGALDRPLDVEEATAFLRASYARGYQDALGEPEPDQAAIRLVEREAWARLPI